MHMIIKKSTLVVLLGMMVGVMMADTQEPVSQLKSPREAIAGAVPRPVVQPVISADSASCLCKINREARLHCNVK